MEEAAKTASRASTAWIGRCVGVLAAHSLSGCDDAVHEGGTLIVMTNDLLVALQWPQFHGGRWETTKKMATREPHSSQLLRGEAIFVVSAPTQPDDVEETSSAQTAVTRTHEHAGTWVTEVR